MRKIYVAVVIGLLMLGIGGCGDHHDRAPRFTTQILSDPAFDGDIARSSGGTFTINQGDTQTVLAGRDPVTGQEYRAFLQFPLTGSDGVPGDAFIESAVLDIFIDDIFPQPLLNPLPIRIDLISYPPSLSSTDFDRVLRPALASTTIQPPIAQSDLGRHVTVDVTLLMREAQRRGLADFQVRILEELGSSPPGFIVINDTTGPQAGNLAPLLEVTYF